MANTSIKMSMDVSELRESASSAAAEIKRLTEAMKEASQAGDWGQVATLSKAMDNLQSYRRDVNREANAAAREQQRNALMPTVVNAGNAGSTAIQNIARGNYAGSAISAVKGTGSAIGGLAKTVGGIAGGALSVLSGVGLLAGAGLAAGNALSEQYEEQMPAMDMLNALWGRNVASNSWQKNSQQGLDYYLQAQQAAAGTGLSTADFMQNAANFARYGLGANRSMALASDAAKWANYTGGNMELFQQIAGMSERYGGSGEKSLQAAYAGAKATGLGKGQTDEFLQAMLRVMEEGISQGFTRGAEEISANADMLYKLSGGSAMWQGEQGMNRMSRMNDAIANATSLSTTNDVLLYSVAQNIMEGKNLDARKKLLDPEGKSNQALTGGWTDTMALLERGVSPDMLKGIFDTVRKTDGGDADAVVSRFKNMFGTNYNEAQQIYSMYLNAQKGEVDWSSFSKEITSMREKHDPESARTKMQDSVNIIQAEVVKIGEKAAELKIDTLDGIAKGVTTIGGGLEKLLDKLIQDENEKAIDSALDGFYSKSNPYDRADKAAAKQALLEGLNSTDPDKRFATQQMLTQLQAWTPEQKDVADKLNLLNSMNFSAKNLNLVAPSLDFKGDGGNYAEDAAELLDRARKRMRGANFKGIDSIYENITKEKEGIFGFGGQDQGFVDKNEFDRLVKAIGDLANSIGKDKDTVINVLATTGGGRGFSEAR